ncbi:MAG: hypothetical protein GY774_36310 [Planctomycetes bacterium]|nr:hypothetical protein [Planctomycetota bacterium]
MAQVKFSKNGELLWLKEKICGKYVKFTGIKTWMMDDDKGEVVFFYDHSMPCLRVKATKSLMRSLYGD